MPASADQGRPASTGWWKCRALDPDGRPVWLAHVGTTLHTDDVYVDLPEAEASALIGDDAVCVAWYDGDLVSALDVTPRGAPRAPPLWFVEMEEAHPTHPAVTLVAFTGHDVEPGSLVDTKTFEGTTATGDDQLGAVRWYPATGEVDQVYVSPDWRRHSIGSGLVVAAGTLAVARGWSRLWGDGQRTGLGDRWRSTSDWAHRTAPLTHLAPPMTPFDRR